MSGCFSFGKASLARLETCHEILREIADQAIIRSPYDFSITEGHRTTQRQQELFRRGLTHIDGISKWGKHNEQPSQAFDFMPWPADIGGADVWTEGRWRFEVVAGVILAVASSRGFKLRWGGDWDGDGSRRDQKLHDLPHIELVAA